MVGVGLNFKETTQLFSKEVEPVYSPISGVREFQSVRILADTRYGQSFKMFTILTRAQ